MTTLAQAVRDVYDEMGQKLTWELWHEMSHQDRVAMALLKYENAKEML